ncbi:MAG: entericidin EcnAB [Myxococcales bacterium]|nr:entericidin EcnAB [Myxococcales bacterium]
MFIAPRLVAAWCLSLVVLLGSGCRNTADGIKADTKRAVEKTGKGVEKVGEKIEKVGK